MLHGKALAAIITAAGAAVLLALTASPASAQSRLDDHVPAADRGERGTRGSRCGLPYRRLGGRLGRQIVRQFRVALRP
jgi:hypothetical protein